MIDNTSHYSLDTEKESNWLPVPRGSIRLTIRIYLPEPEVLEHTWRMPLRERVK
jgi:hypothetical protein